MSAKANQSIELLKRVKARLANSDRYAYLEVAADEIVVGFLICQEELQKMKVEGYGG